MAKLTFTYFSTGEFACPCCRGNKASFALIERLDIARSIARVPFSINSGYRCPTHNKQVGGKPTSSHLKGLAADIRAVHASERFAIVRGLLAAGFTRIGIGKDFVHVDIDTDKPQNLIWTYYDKHK